MVEWRIALSDLTFDEAEEAALLRVLRRRWISAGPETHAFEDEFAAAVGVQDAVAVSSGTAALHLTLMALGVSRGSEVIQPALNFVSAANVTTMVNASPVFADVISLDDPTLNPEQAAAMLSPATAAVVPMHYGGQAAKVSELIAVAGRVGAAVIEDACHALGGLYRESSSLGGRPVGAAGAAGCYSFFSNKNLACGEGGMIATDRRDIADQARLLRSHGMTSLSWDRHQGHATGYTVERPGLNYRMDDLRAAVGRAQLVKLKRNTEARQDLVANYRRLMAEVDGWAVPFSQQVLDGSAAHLMVVLAPDSSSRDRTRERLARAGIQTSFHYPCVADFPPFRDCRSDGLPVTREFVSRALTLPLHPLMGSEDVEAVVETVAAAT